MKTNCTVYRTADFIGKRWTILILLELHKGGGKLRYSEIKARIPGITGKMLSARLKELECESLVSKKISSDSIPIVCEYSLTKSAKEFIGIISEMKSWALKWKFDNKVCECTECANCKF